MAFQYLSNTDLHEARAQYLAALQECGAAPRVETVPVTAAQGRVTAEPVYAHISAPHYNASAMDGIAVEAARTFGATATTPVVLQSDDYVVVDTGDPLPPDCDAVVMIEDVIVVEHDDLDEQTAFRQGTATVELRTSIAPWGNVRQIGEDICAGEMILTSGVTIDPFAIGALLAAGIGEVAVFSQPVVGIIPTGDEVVPPSDDPSEGDVMEFNSAIFSGMIASWGGQARTYDIVHDKLELIVAALEQAASECDCVLLIAGSSAGRDDYASQAISTVGTMLIHGLAIKPGKPAVLGLSGRTAIMGMPGYPVSGIIVAEEILRPVIELLAGRILPPHEMAKATLSRRIVSSLKYLEFVRMSLGVVDGTLIGTPLPRGAGVVSSLLKADGMLAIPQDIEGLEAGSQIEVRLMRPLVEIEQTLVVTGSHDPIIDEVAQLLHVTYPDKRVASTHVGSMGAITAAKRHENHCGGIHLLDETTGIYNQSYLEKHFPQGGVRQVECVYRQQGLMVASGNPKSIRSMADLTLPGMRFVNRQKGSGTRILSDYTCRVENIDPRDITGYDREVFTHLEVAALVQSGSADAGMGVYSAAQQYGLDFIPITEEQYDLLIPDYAWDIPQVQALIEVLHSDAFKQRAQDMGGYRVEAPGTVRQHF